MAGDLLREKKMKITKDSLRLLIEEVREEMQEEKPASKPKKNAKSNSNSNAKMLQVRKQDTTEELFKVLKDILDQLKSLNYYATPTRGAAAAIDPVAGATYVNEEDNKGEG